MGHLKDVYSEKSRDMAYSPVDGGNGLLDLDREPCVLVTVTSVVWRHMAGAQCTLARVYE